MALPGILGTVSEGLQTSDSSSWTLTYPSGVQQGELLLILATSDGNLASDPTATNWIINRGASGGNASQEIFGKKLATGTESGNFTMTLSAAEQGCWKVVRIGPWEGTIGANFTNSDYSGGAAPWTNQTTGTGTSIGLPGTIPFVWTQAVVTTDDWLVLHHYTADGGDTVLPSTLSGYTLLGTNQASGGAGGATQVVFYRSVRGGTDGAPGSVSVSPSSAYAAGTVCVRGRIDVTYPAGGRGRAESTQAAYGPVLGFTSANPGSTPPANN